MAYPLQEIILTSSPDGLITAYDASSGSKLAYFNGSKSPQKGITLVGKKKIIAASHFCPDTGRGFVHLYNWWSSTAFHKITMPEPVAPLVATLDGLYLFSGGLSGQIHSISLPIICDDNDDVTHSSFPAHSKPITCLEINDDSSLLLSGSDDGNISVFSIHRVLDHRLLNFPSSSSRNNLALHRFSGHKSSVTAIVTGIGGCNCTVISCSLDSTCKIWNLMQEKPLRTISFPCATLAVTMDPIESVFYVAGSDGLIYRRMLNKTTFHKMKQGNELMSWNIIHHGRPRQIITSMATISWGKTLVTASEDGKVCTWDIKKGEFTMVLDQQAGVISHLVIARKLQFGEVDIGRMNKTVVCCSKMELGSSEKELSRPIKELMKIEEELSDAVKDRRRSIETLELAIGAYEKLLKLILKEAKSGSKNLVYHND